MSCGGDRRVRRQVERARRAGRQHPDDGVGHVVGMDHRDGQPAVQGQHRHVPEHAAGSRAGTA